MTDIDTKFCTGSRCYLVYIVTLASEKIVVTYRSAQRASRTSLVLIISVVCRQYRSLIFYHSTEQRMVAETSLRERERLSGRKLPTLILPAGQLHIAEE